MRGGHESGDGGGGEFQERLGAGEEYMGDRPRHNVLRVKIPSQLLELSDQRLDAETIARLKDGSNIVSDAVDPEATQQIIYESQPQLRPGKGYVFNRDHTDPDSMLPQKSVSTYSPVSESRGYAIDKPTHGGYQRGSRRVKRKGRPY